MRGIWNFVASAVAGVAIVGASPVFAQQDNLLQKIKDKGTLRVCTAGYSPWTIKNPVTNVWEGIVPEIVKEVGENLKVKVEWVDVTWATIIPSLQSDKCDLAATALWTAPQRAEVISFTRPIGSDGMSIFVPASSNARSLADLDQKGKIITVAAGSGDERTAKSLFKNAEVKSVVADRANSAVMEVAAGRADGASAAFSGTAQLIKVNPNLKVKPIEGLIYNETPFAFGTPPREYFFRDYMNVIIGNMETAGKLQEIKDKWTKLR